MQTDANAVKGFIKRQADKSKSKSNIKIRNRHGSGDQPMGKTRQNQKKYETRGQKHDQKPCIKNNEQKAQDGTGGSTQKHNTSPGTKTHGGLNMQTNQKGETETADYNDDT